MLKRSVLKIARKKMLLSFQYDFNNPYQLPKPKRHSYSQGNKGFIVIVFNLSLTNLKRHIQTEVQYSLSLLFPLPSYLCSMQCLSDTAMLTKKLLKL